MEKTNIPYLITHNPSPHIHSECKLETGFASAALIA